MKADIEKLKKDQALLREMVEMHKKNGIPPLSDLIYYLRQSTWNLRKILFRIKKQKKEQTP